MARSYTKYTDWITAEFAPRTLATPTATIQQQVENAIRYWNTHSAYKLTTMVDWTIGNKRVQLNTQYKSVVDIYPSTTTTWIWNDHPLWSLIGMTIMDNVTGDMIMLSEAFRNYRAYVGTNFRYMWQKSDDPSVGGYVYAVNVPAGTEKLAVIGTKRITGDEDVVVPVIYNWILYYTKALVKQIEGNTLRAADIIDVKNDGQELVSEGKEEMKHLQEQLLKESVWVTFMKRF